MVWGMGLSGGSSGEFWPDGEFEGVSRSGSDAWWQRLTDYYKEQTPEEQKRLFDFKGDPREAARFYGTFPTGKFTHERGTKDRNGLEPVFGNVEPHEIPHSWNTGKTYKTLGSLIKFHSMVIAVDEALKTIIERLEAGMHEFFELPIVMPKGVIYPERYYILRVGQYFDAFSLRDSASDVTREVEAYYDPQSGELVTPAYTTYTAKGLRTGIKGIAVRKAIFGSAHLWRDRFFQENLTCFSDELIAEIEKAGLRIPKHYKMKEVGEVTPGTAIMQEAA